MVEKWESITYVAYVKLSCKQNGKKGIGKRGGYGGSVHEAAALAQRE